MFVFNISTGKKIIVKAGDFFMMDIKRCSLSRQGQELNHWIAEGILISPRSNARVFYAMDENSMRKRTSFREDIMEQDVG